MTPEDRLRSSLQRMVPPPDERGGWQQVNRRIVRAHRVRVAVVGMAAVVALGIGATVVSAVQADGPQRVNTASPPQTTGTTLVGGPVTSDPQTPATTPASDPTATTGPIGGSATPATTPGPGGSSITPASTSGSAPGGRPTPTQATSPTTVPAAGAGDPTTATTQPTAVTDPTTATTDPAGATPASTPAVISDADLRSQISGYLDGHSSLIRTVQDTHVGSSAVSGGRQLVVQVTLRADATAVADELLARWPGHVQVILGFFQYPGPPPSGQTCVAGAAAAPVPSTVATSARVPSVSRGADFSGTVTVTNHTTAALPVGGGTNTVDLLLPGTATVVATYDGTGATSTGGATTLAPGASTDITVSGATASCTGLGGYSLPPGTYDGRVHILVGGIQRDLHFPVTITP